VGATVVPLQWEAVSAVAALLAATISIFALVVQVRGLKRSLASATYQELVRAFNDYQALMRQRADLYHAIYKERLGIRSPNPRMEHDVKWTLGHLFNWYESAAIQAELYRAIPTSLTSHWKAMLAHEMSSEVVRDYWSKYAERFHPALRKWADEVLSLSSDG
jgi:hypothetical protein